MTVLSVAQSVAAKVGINPVPTSLFGESGRTFIEMRETVQESARQIADAYDWSPLKRVATVTGDGTATEFALVSDFDRLIKDAQLYRSGNLGYDDYEYVQDFNQLVAMQADSEYVRNYGGYWSIYGGMLYIYSGYNNDPIPLASSVKFGYITSNIVRSSADVLKSAFTADDDIFVLDERLLKLLVISNWKEAHGQSYAEDYDRYQDALEVRRIADRNPQTIISNGGRSPFGPLRFE